MRFVKFIFGVLILSVLFSACTKDELEKEYKKTTLQLEFNTHVNGDSFILNDQLYDDYLGRKYRVELLKFYMSNWALEKKNGTLVNFGDVELVDYSVDNGLDFEAIIDTGVYVNFHFGIGLDPETNASDPATFASSNPLSIAQNTYWTWASKYKFFMIEGRVDTLGLSNPDQVFSYHSGFDTLYRVITIPLEDLCLNSESETLAFEMDLNKVLNGENGTIDFVSESFSHSESDFELVERISDNLLSSFSLLE